LPSVIIHLTADRPQNVTNQHYHSRFPVRFFRSPKPPHIVANPPHNIQKRACLLLLKYKISHFLFFRFSLLCPHICGYKCKKCKSQNQKTSIVIYSAIYYNENGYGCFAAKSPDCGASSALFGEKPVPFFVHFRLPASATGTPERPGSGPFGKGKSAAPRQSHIFPHHLFCKPAEK